MKLLVKTMILLFLVGCVSVPKEEPILHDTKTHYESRDENIEVRNFTRETYQQEIILKFQIFSRLNRMVYGIDNYYKDGKFDYQTNSRILKEETISEPISLYDGFFQKFNAEIVDSNLITGCYIRHIGDNGNVELQITPKKYIYFSPIKNAQIGNIDLSNGQKKVENMIVDLSYVPPIFQSYRVGPQRSVMNNPQNGYAFYKCNDNFKCIYHKSLSNNVTIYDYENSFKKAARDISERNIKNVEFITADINSKNAFSDSTVTITPLGVIPSKTELASKYFKKEIIEYISPHIHDYLSDPETKEITNNMGGISFNLMFPSKYKIRIIHPNYHPVEREVFITKDSGRLIFYMADIGSEHREIIVEK